MCLVLLAGLFWTIDVRGWRRWAFPFVVFGMNSIGIYILGNMWGRWLRETLGKHLDHSLLAWASDATATAVKSLLAFGILWLVFYWMYRRKVFLRV